MLPPTYTCDPVPDAVFGCSTCAVVPAPVLAARANGAVVSVCPREQCRVPSRPGAHVRSSHSLRTRCTPAAHSPGRSLAAGSLGWLGWRRSIPDRSEQETDNSLVLIPTRTPQARTPSLPPPPLFGRDGLECGGMRRLRDHSSSSGRPTSRAACRAPSAIGHLQSAIRNPQSAVYSPHR